MTQYAFEPLSSEDSGMTLLERLNGLVPALLTNHKGAARPGYVQPGMLWIDDSGAEWLLNIHDGANDVSLARIDPTTHAVTLPAVPTTRKLKVGAGLSIDGVNGTDAAPAVGDLSADRLLRLNLAALGLTLATWTAAGALDEAPISPAKLYTVIGAQAAQRDPGYSGISSILMARNNFNAALSSNGGVAGTYLSATVFTPDERTSWGGSLPGTWRNIGGPVAVGGYGFFQRVV